jgi:hypothetical protein
MNDKLKLNGFLSLLIVAVGLPLGAIAGTAERHELRIAIDDGSEDGQVFIELHDDSGVNVRDLQVGESQSVVDAQGRPVLVTRLEDGLEFNVDGRIIELPELVADAANLGPGEYAGVESEKEVIVVNSKFAADEGGVTIISDEPIDEATRDGIRALLSSAGYTDGVVFLDAAGPQGGSGDAHHGTRHRQIKVISQEVNATN